MKKRQVRVWTGTACDSQAEERNVSYRRSVKHLVDNLSASAQDKGVLLTCSVVLHFPLHSCSTLYLLQTTTPDGLQLAVSMCPCVGITQEELFSASSYLDGFRVTHTLLPCGCYPIFALPIAFPPRPSMGLRQCPAEAGTQFLSVQNQAFPTHYLGLKISICPSGN